MLVVVSLFRELIEVPPWPDDRKENSLSFHHFLVWVISTYEKVSFVMESWLSFAEIYHSVMRVILTPKITGIDS